MSRLLRLIPRRHFASLANGRSPSGRFADGPSLADFMRSDANGADVPRATHVPAAAPPYLAAHAEPRSFAIETFGCQMNVADSEIVRALLLDAGFVPARDTAAADVVLLNTCAIRDKAETRIWARLSSIRAERRGQRPVTIGILGCMAERLKEKLLEKDRLADVVCGPDAYRNLPHLLRYADDSQQTAIDVQLSADETYADVAPVRESAGGVSAFVSIMRGCSNLCTYCIVPFTRGRERSRPVESIVSECEDLYKKGYREVCFLGQNVNSYNDVSQVEEPAAAERREPREGFKTVYKAPVRGTTFAELVERVSTACPNLRIRFTSPHPKDFPDELLALVKERPNVCAQLHVPAQSGNSVVLDRMRRGYTRETYLDLAKHIRERVPGVALSSDFISGFCGETEEQHRETLSLMREVGFEQAFMFAYSLREKTAAHRRYNDDVPEDVKKRRLAEVIATFRHIALERNRAEIGLLQVVLVEDTSRRNEKQWMGRSDRNRKVILADRRPTLPFLSDLGVEQDEQARKTLAELEKEPSINGPIGRQPITKGTYVLCRAVDASGAVTLHAEPIAIVDSLRLAAALTSDAVPRALAAADPAAIRTERGEPIEEHADRWIEATD